MTTTLLRIGCLVSSLGSALTVAAWQDAPALTGAAPLVYVAEVDSIIHPVSAEYMIETMELADRNGATLIVFTLRTPGGLVDSTRSIVSRMIAAKTPVAVFVAPAGARAASAGFFLTIAADIDAMAPGTHIGAAHPVAAGGEKMDETMAKKAAEDVAAYARTLASHRHRNATLAALAVTESRAFTEEEALGASPPLIDLVAADVPELLKKLHGRTVTRFDGSTLALRTEGARVVPVAMSLRQRVLSAIANPNVAYLLLSLGTLGLTVELWSPGAVLPGVAGGLLPVAGVFCAADVAGQLRRTPSDSVRPDAPRARNQGHELRPVDSGRPGKPRVRVDDSHGFADPRTAVEPARRGWVLPGSPCSSSGLASPPSDGPRSPVWPA